MEAGDIDPHDLLLVKGAEVVLDDARGDTNDVVALPVLDEAEHLERAHYVVRSDGRPVADLLDTQLAAVVVQQLQHAALPVRPVGNLRGEVPVFNCCSCLGCLWKG